jgi:hypothetical protein
MMPVTRFCACLRLAHPIFTVFVPSTSAVRVPAGQSAAGEPERGVYGSAAQTGRVFQALGLGR